MEVPFARNNSGCRSLAALVSADEAISVDATSDQEHDYG